MDIEERRRYHSMVIGKDLQRYIDIFLETIRRELKDAPMVLEPIEHSKGFSLMYSLVVTYEQRPLGHYLRECPRESLPKRNWLKVFEDFCMMTKYGNAYALSDSMAYDDACAYMRSKDRTGYELPLLGYGYEAKVGGNSLKAAPDVIE